MAKKFDTDETKTNHYIDEMLRYKQDIVDALNNPASNSERTFENDDRSKNAMIMSAMLDNCDEIIMYCGKMSVFRKNFYQHIDKVSQGAGATIQQEVRQSLDKFIAGNHKLTIILEDYEKHYLDDLISDKIRKSEYVSIKKVDKDRLLTSMLSHTALGKKDNRVVIKRRETNSLAYSARCLVNLNKEMAEDSVTLMSYIEEASHPVSR